MVQINRLLTWTEMMREFLLILLLFSSSCDKVKRSSRPDSVPKEIYNVDVIYLIDSVERSNGPNYYNREKLRDSIYLFAEHYFEKDSIEIIVNDEVFNASVLTSDPRSSLAEVFCLGPVSKVNSVALKINNGPLVCLDMFPTNIIILTYQKKENVSIAFKSKPNVYE
jgi:hypothetical protein